jgi:hypothetical protein
MSTPPSQQNDFLAARTESCRLLGLNPDDLSPHEMIRCDLLTVLRLWLDGSQSALLSGGTADPTKILAVADVLGKLVPETEHKSRGEDPRSYMWRTYSEMRRRGALAGEGLDGLKLTVERLTAELASKDARIGELEASLAGSVPLPPNAVKLRNDLGRPAAPAAPPKPAPQPPRPLRIGEAWSRERGFYPIPPKPNDPAAPPAAPQPQAAPAAAAPVAPRDWDSTDSGRKWRDWYGGGGSYGVPGSIGDRWSDHRE